ncbi:Tudor [Gracilaria domingensis]|nr:Tudor [Gracilaria domingensis]
MSLDSQAATPIAGLRAGQVVAARLSADKEWYRACISYVHKSGEIDLRFLDYGNEDRVFMKDIWHFGTAGGVATAAPIAVEVALANVVVPAEDEPCGIPAGEYLQEMIYGKEVNVSASSTKGPSRVIGGILVSNAGARFIRKRDRASRAAFKELRQFEEVGIASRAYLWNYGEALELDFDEDC